MISKQTSEKQHLKPVKYTKWATRSFWSLSSSQDLESWDSYWHWCQVQHWQEIWVFSIAMATTFWKEISQKSSEKSTTCHWLRLQMSVAKRKLDEPDLGIDGLEGEDFCLLIFRVDLLKTTPMHLQSVCLALLILSQNSRLQFSLCFPPPTSTQTVETWTRCRRSRSLKNTRKQSFFTGAVLEEQQKTTVRLVGDHITQSYFSIPLRCATNCCLPLT